MFKDSARALHSVLKWLPILTILSFVGMCAVSFDGILQRNGLSGSYAQSALWWWLAGLVFAFGWPLRYWRGMKGLWRKSIPGILVTSLTGPFAIILGFPL